MFRPTSVLIVAMLGACAGTGRSAGVASNTSTARPENAECVGPAPAHSECQVPRCVQAKWQLAAVGPRTVCELSPNMAERQDKALPVFRGDPGVCFAGECLPRALCAERCADRISDELAAPFAQQLAPCRGQPPGISETCANDLRSDPIALRRVGVRVLACLDECGFPPARLNTQLMPDPSAPPPEANPGE